MSKHEKSNNDILPSLKNIESHRTNPFIIDLQGKMYVRPKSNVIISKNQSIIDTETGEIINDGAVLMGRQIKVDKSEFAKIYVSELGALMDMSKKAINVLIYLMKTMDFENKSYFNYTIEHMEVGYKSDVPALNGIRELIKSNIIAPAVMPHYYWINPVYVCKGERFAKYTEFVMTDNKEKRESELKVKGLMQSHATNVMQTDIFGGVTPLIELSDE